MNVFLRKGFTLVELLVVIAIVGILSGLIIVGMNSSVQQATIAKAQVFSSSLRNSLLNNLISEWKLDDGSGSVALDSWGGNNNGALEENGYAGACDATHCPQWKTSGCVYDKCLSFDGSNDYVDLGNPSALTPTSAITISMWAKKNYNSAAIYRGLMGKLRPIGGGALSYRLGAYGDRIMFDTYGLSDTSISSPAGSYSSTDWTNIVVSYTGSMKYIYINGNLSQSEAATGTITTNTKNLVIGGDGDGNGGLESGNDFSGLIDEVRMFNSGIITSQIMENYFIGINHLLSRNSISREEYIEDLDSLNYALKD